MLFKPGEYCEICDSREGVLEQCSMCGAYSCENCMVDEEKICLTCQEARCFICAEYLASRACDRCGRLVCEDHGVKENEATVCDLCRANET